MECEMTRLNSSGHLVLPEAIMDKLGLHGSNVAIYLEGNHLVIKKLKMKGIAGGGVTGEGTEEI